MYNVIVSHKQVSYSSVFHVRGNATNACSRARIVGSVSYILARDRASFALNQEVQAWNCAITQKYVTVTLRQLKAFYLVKVVFHDLIG